MKTRLSFTFDQDDTWERDAILSATKMRCAFEDVMGDLRNRIKHGENQKTTWSEMQQILLVAFEDARKGWDI